MNFILSRSSAEWIRDSVRVKPLTIGEIRRIEKMDDWYFALSITPVDENIYSELFRVQLDGVSHVCYRRRI